MRRAAAATLRRRRGADETMAEHAADQREGDGVPLAALLQRPPDIDDLRYRRLITGVIAQLCARPEHASVSASNVIVRRDGTPEVRGDGPAEVEHAAAVLALGVLLWEGLAQRKLPAGDAPRLEEDGLPARIADVVATALARSPDQRQATAAQLRKELVLAMVADGGVMLTDQIAAAVNEHWLSSPAANDVKTPAAVPRTPLLAWTLAALLSIGVIVCAIVLVVRAGPPPAGDDPPRAPAVDARVGDAAPVRP
jgi:hypothetical protein